VTPWEESGDLVGTLRAILRDPVGFYRGADPEGPVSRPLLFGVMVGTVGSVFTILWQALAALLGLTATDVEPVATLLRAAGACLVSPIGMTVALLAGAGLTHLALLVIGGARRGYGATLRVTAYAQAPHVLSVVPVCGAIVGGVWSLVLTVIGLREVHETTTGRAIAAVVLPVVVCVCLAAGVGVLIAFVLHTPG